MAQSTDASPRHHAQGSENRPGWNRRLLTSSPGEEAIEDQAVHQPWTQPLLSDGSVRTEQEASSR